MEADTPIIHFGAGNTDSAIRVTNIATPTTNKDATNKEYVDSLVRGLTIKPPVRLLVSTNTLLTSLVAGYQVDGTLLRLGDRIILIGQENAVQNGIYTVQETGAERAADLPTGTSATGVYAFVDEGTEFKDRAFVCITDRLDAAGEANAIVGTHTLQWVQFSARSEAMAGNGLVTGVGSQLDVNVDGATIEVVADVVKIKNPDIKVKVERGLLRSTTDGTTASTAVVDSIDPAVLGTTVPLGSNITVAPDFTVLADVQNANTFLATNTFSNASTASWTVDGTLDGNPNIVLNGTIVVNNGGIAVKQNIIASDASLKGTTDSSSVTTGTLVVDGGVGIAKALHCGGDVHAMAMHATSTDASSWSATEPLTGALTVDGGAVIRNDLHSLTLNVHGDADSTSKTTGALVLKGGLGVEKNIIADTTHLIATEASTSTTTGALTVAGGAGIAGDLHATDIYGQNVRANASTASTSTTTGALVVQGGTGIGGNLHVGNEAHVTNTVHCDAATNSTWHVTAALTGSLLVEGGASIRQDLHALNTYVHSTTQSTSTTTGALVVSGGVGVSGNVFCTNTFNMSDQRLKKNVKTLDDALERVCNMRGCSFEWNERMPGLENTSCIGVIAQELKEQAPLCVNHDPVTDLYAVEPGFCFGRQCSDVSTPSWCHS